MVILNISPIVVQNLSDSKNVVSSGMCGISTVYTLVLSSASVAADA